MLPGGVAVNVATGQLGRPGLALDVESSLSRHGLPGTQLTVEITETTALPDPAVPRSELEALRAIGVHVLAGSTGRCNGWVTVTG